MSSATTKLEWDKDVVKHFVRRTAWLPAVVSQAKACKEAKRDFKYFTFCAAEAIDVFLFLREGALKRDAKTGSVENTYFCEKDEQDFNTISQLIGPHEQGFLGDFQDMILFEDDTDTEGRRYSDVEQQYSGDVRSRLSIKERHLRFRCKLPFDVINLDICGTFFPPKDGVLSPMVKSIRKLLEWQTQFAEEDPNFDSFTVFLTTHVETGKVNKDALQELITVVDTNGETFAGFAKGLEERFGTTEGKKIAEKDFPSFYSMALPKVVIGEAFQRGWTVTPTFSGQYRRKRRPAKHGSPSSYSMLAWVGHFRRHRPGQLKLGLPDAAKSRDYVTLINEVIAETQDVNQEASKVSEEIKADLDRVVSYRDAYLDKIKSGN